MENISELTGHTFKVKNTWEHHKTWNQGGYELMNTKLLSALKPMIKHQIADGRINEMYFEECEWQGNTRTVFFFKTKNTKVSVILKFRSNINQGTWYGIQEIKIENPTLEINI